MVSSSVSQEDLRPVELVPPTTTSVSMSKPSVQRRCHRFRNVRPCRPNILVNNSNNCSHVNGGNGSSNIVGVGGPSTTSTSTSAVSFATGVVVNQPSTHGNGGVIHSTTSIHPNHHSTGDSSHGQHRSHHHHSHHHHPNHHHHRNYHHRAMSTSETASIHHHFHHHHHNQSRRCVPPDMAATSKAVSSIGSTTADQQSSALASRRRLASVRTTSSPNRRSLSPTNNKNCNHTAGANNNGGSGGVGTTNSHHHCCHHYHGVHRCNNVSCATNSNCHFGAISSMPDKRRLREKRRSLGLLLLNPSTESAGGSSTNNDDGDDDDDDNDGVGEKQLADCDNFNNGVAVNRPCHASESSVTVSRGSSSLFGNCYSNLPVAQVMPLNLTRRPSRRIVLSDAGVDADDENDFSNTDCSQSQVSLTAASTSAVSGSEIVMNNITDGGVDGDSESVSTTDVNAEDEVDQEDEDHLSSDTCFSLIGDSSIIRDSSSKDAADEHMGRRQTIDQLAAENAKLMARLAEQDAKIEALVQQVETLKSERKSEHC